MSERPLTMDDTTMKLGFLMESAQVHQKSADSLIEKLRSHTEDLDGVVRDEIRRTLIEELQMLTAEAGAATRALQRVKRASSLRGLLWSLGMALLSAGIPIAIIRWATPSNPEISALRARRDELAASIATLEQRGGRIEWRRCGAASRLCVRIDRSAPTFGEKADYYVVAGY
jgi:hypothetical protein